MIAFGIIVSEAYLRIIAAENVAWFFGKFHLDDSRTENLIRDFSRQIFEEDTVFIHFKIDLLAAYRKTMPPEGFRLGVELMIEVMKENKTTS